MRESRRLASELFETMRGGGASISGLAGLFRFAVLSAEALGPAGLAITGIGLALTSLLAKHEGGDGAKKQIDDTKESTDAWANSNDRVTRALEEISKSEFWGVALRNAKQLTTEFDSQGKALKVVQQAEDELKSARLGRETADLNKQEQDELRGKSSDQAQQIRDKYDALRDQARNRFDAVKAGDEAKRAQAELARLQGEKQNGQNQVAASDSDRDRAALAERQARLAIVSDQSDLEFARTQTDSSKSNSLAYRQANAGSDDGNGGKVQPLTDYETIQLQELINGLPQIIKNAQENSGPQFTEQIALTKAHIDLLEKQEEQLLKDSESDPRKSAQISQQYGGEIAHQRAFLERATTYEAAQKNFKTASDDASKTYAEFAKGLGVLNAQIEAATISLDTARTKGEQTHLQGAATSERDVRQAGQDESKAAFSKRAAARDVQIGDNESELKNPLLIPAQKAAIQATIDEIKQAAYKDQLQHAAELGLSDAEKIRLAGQISASGKDAAYAVQSQQVKAENVDEKRKLTEEINSTKLQIQGTGNATAIAQVRQILANFVDKTEQLAALQELLSEVATGRLPEIDRHEKNARHNVGSHVPTPAAKQEPSAPIVMFVPALAAPQAVAPVAGSTPSLPPAKQILPPRRAPAPQPDSLSAPPSQPHPIKYEPPAPGILNPSHTRVPKQDDPPPAPKAPVPPAASQADELSPSQGKALAAHEAVQALDKRSSQGAGQLNQTLSSILATAKALEPAQAARDAAILKQLKAFRDELDKRVARTENAVHSLRT
jgi:hypothetical protein